MEKSDWKEALKKLQVLRETALNNKNLATDQLEELDFTISKYKEKIKSISTS